MLWTDANLAEWRATIPADWPEWRREHHEMYRRQNCPTFREERAALRWRARHLVIDQLRKARVVPGWLTERGVEEMHRQIARIRQEHTSLARCP